jgi:hypothetical protein
MRPRENWKVHIPTKTVHNEQNKSKLHKLTNTSEYKQVLPTLGNTITDTRYTITEDNVTITDR